MNKINKKGKRYFRLYTIRTLRFVYSVVMGFVVLMGALVMVLFFMGIRPYAVVSGSMEPAIHVGSVCIVDMNFPFKNIKAGDVISIKNGELAVTHRVTAVTSQGLVTKGDANNTEDTGYVTADNYFGKNVYSIPFAGYAVIFLKSRAGKAFGVGVIFLALLTDYILDLALDIAREEYKAKREKGDDGDEDEEKQEN